MKQFLSLWERYALLATHRRANKHDDKPVWLRVSYTLNQGLTRRKVSLKAIYKYCIYTGESLRKPWRILRWTAKGTPLERIEESCVCTHAKAPARSGLGLALGLVVLLVQMMTVHAQLPESSGVVSADKGNYVLPTITSEQVTDTMNLNRITKLVPDADLDRFPVRKYHVNAGVDFRGLRIGDSIPEVVWNLPLWVVNHPDGKDTITLADYRSEKLLVLDFWAKWCAPCVESMDKWTDYVRQSDGDIQLLGVHLDFDYKALPFSRERGWKAPSIIGQDAYLINRLFFDRDVISRMVWIRDGKLAAITSSRGYNLEMVKKFANSEPIDIPMDTNWTYPLIGEQSKK